MAVYTARCGDIVRGSLQCNKGIETNFIAYDTYPNWTCPQAIKLNLDKGLPVPTRKLYPMEPIGFWMLPLYWGPVQKVCQEYIPAFWSNPTPGLYGLAHFLVIAAPRPFDWQDLEHIQASVTKGRFFAPFSGGLQPRCCRLHACEVPAFQVQLLLVNEYVEVCESVPDVAVMVTVLVCGFALADPQAAILNSARPSRNTPVARKS